MSVNQHIRDELEWFRRMPGDAFYALQINAPWGAGKSHFISDYLNEITPPTTSDEDPISVRVTLFGAQKTSDLENQIIAQIFSKSDRIVGTIFSGLVTGIAKRVQADKIADDTIEAARYTSIKNRLQRVRGGLIVFDDLERSGIPLKDALGYINRFVELEGFKVVIISNEDAFSRPGASKEDQENFVFLKAFKEKLVGRTMRLVADPQAVFENFTSKILTEKAMELAKEEKDRILRVFESSGRENLRSLRVGLEAFDRIASILAPEVLAKKDALIEIALACLYVSLEVAAAVDISIVRSPTAGRLKRLVAGLGFRQENEGSATEQTSDDIVKRYDEFVNFQSPVIPLDLLVDFIALGQLDISSINEFAKVSSLVAVPSELPPWRSLVEIWDMDIESLQTNTERARNQLEKLRVRDPGEMLHLAGIMLWRASNDDLTLSDGLQPVDFIRKYLNTLHSAGENLDPLKGMSKGLVAAHGFIPIAPEASASDMKQILGLIQESANRALQKRLPEIREKINKFFISKDRVFSDLYATNNELSNFVGLPIFAGQNPSVFVDAILRDLRFDVGLLDWLSERYKLAGDTALLIAEGAWLQGVASGLKDRIATLPAPLNRFWQKLTDARLSPIITRLAELSRSEHDNDGESLQR